MLKAKYISPLVFFFFITLKMPLLHATKEYEIWWENCLDKEIPIDTFEDWLGDLNSPSRVAMRQHVKKAKYKTLLDVPAGLCIDYFGLMADKVPVSYQGADITPKLVALAQKNNIPITLADIKALPYPNSSFDASYARHILEHLETYEEAINELIRVASKEVLITFFIKPADTTKIYSSYENGYKLYHNTYCKKDLENFVTSHPKVSSIKWEDIGENETILHILVKSKRK